MSAYTAPGLATGLTVVATTQTALSFGIIDVTLPSQKVKAIDVSVMSTTGGMPYIFGKLIDNGELKLKVQNKVDLNPATYLGISDTFTITFPKSPASATTSATAVFTGALMDYAPSSVAVDGLFEADVTIKVSGNIVFTAQS
jgi:hypothetical protein